MLSTGNAALIVQARILKANGVDGLIVNYAGMGMVEGSVEANGKSGVKFHWRFALARTRFTYDPRQRQANTFYPYSLVWQRFSFRRLFPQPEVYRIQLNGVCVCVLDQFSTSYTRLSKVRKPIKRNLSSSRQSLKIIFLVREKI